MHKIRRSVAAAAFGYLCGTVPSAKMVTRLVDGRHISQLGSGNPGAANVTATLGRRAGAIVMAADMAKGAIGSVGGRAVAGIAGGHLAGTAAVVGHCYPIWSRFGGGGKGVATSGGQMLATFPAYLPIDLALGAVASRSKWWRTHHTEATGIICVLWVGLSALWTRKSLPNLWGGAPSIGLPIAAAASSAVIMHRFRSAPPDQPAIEATP